MKKRIFKFVIGFSGLFVLAMLLISCPGWLGSPVLGAPSGDVGWIGPAGGYVFYDKGSYSDGWRYLEAAPAGWSGSEQDPRVLFGFYKTPSPTAVGTSTGIGTGATNTATLVSKMGGAAYISKSADMTTNPNYAAKRCDDYSVGEYDDWFLPSKDELNAMFQNLHSAGLGGLTSHNSYAYWCSSENLKYGGYATWAEFFSSGNFGSYDRGNLYFVRPARAF
ncbi:MAG: hypothetical protein AB1407_01680 [Spirochaetota bacterium]